MVAKIKGTDLLMDGDAIIDAKGKVLTKDITVKWYGETMKCTEEWLKNIHKFNIHSTNEEIGKRLRDVRFVKHNRDIDGGGVEAYSIYLINPIDINGYRVIARYPKYAINEKGDVINLVNNTIRKMADVLKKYEKYKEHNKYPFIYLFDSRLGISTKVYLHILLCTTWVYNDDWRNYIVNHIDHDKTNLKLDNLEWVNSSDNTLKYYEHRNRP